MKNFYINNEESSCLPHYCNVMRNLEEKMLTPVAWSLICLTSEPIKYQIKCSVSGQLLTRTIPHHVDIGPD